MEKGVFCLIIYTKTNFIGFYCWKKTFLRRWSLRLISGKGFITEKRGNFSVFSSNTRTFDLHLVGELNFLVKLSYKKLVKCQF